MSIEAMKQALEALEELMPTGSATLHLRDSAITALRQAIEEEERDNRFPAKLSSPNLEQILNAAGFYRKKKWIGLTKEDIDALQYSGDTRVDYVLYDEGDYGVDIDIFPEKFARAIEAKLKEKNT